MTLNTDQREAVAGELKKLAGTLNLTDDQKAANRVISRHRVVVEHVMAQLNRFGVLRQTFRGVFGRHTQVFRVVALLVDRRIAVVPLKTYPTAA